jgi:hypothetical protein
VVLRLEVVVRISVQLLVQPLVRVVVAVPEMYWKQAGQAEQVEREMEVLVVKPSVQPS